MGTLHLPEVVLVFLLLLSGVVRGVLCSHCDLFDDDLQKWSGLMLSYIPRFEVSRSNGEFRRLSILRCGNGLQLHTVSQTAYCCAQSGNKSTHTVTTSTRSKLKSKPVTIGML